MLIQTYTKYKHLHRFLHEPLGPLFIPCISFLNKNTSSTCCSNGFFEAVTVYTLFLLLTYEATLRVAKILIGTSCIRGRKPMRPSDTDASLCVRQDQPRK